MTLLSIKNLNTIFKTRNGQVQACKNIDLDIEAGQTVGIIGETGCGKSVLGMSILKLLPYNARVTGEIRYLEENLLTLSDQAMREIRGGGIGLLPQSPSTSLNPALKIGAQIEEGLIFHRKMGKSAAKQKAVDLLAFLGIKKAEKVSEQFPHQLSGGMKQRALAAISITGQPRLLIADEPTKGLDAIVKTQVVELLRQLKTETGATLLLITHDLKVAQCLCDKIVVMYSGEIIEMAETKKIFEKPSHPYTRGLLQSQPGAGMTPIPGQSPSLSQVISGCRFYDRCEMGQAACQCERAPLREINGSQVRCNYAD
ncbi:Oligopeptide transport ATP-binding protein OppD [anaerobic digester metagenome]